MFLQINGFKQKQPFPGVTQKYFSEKFRKTHKKAPVPELFPLRNLFKITIFYLVSNTGKDGFAKIVNGFQPLIIFAKRSILDV